MVTLRSALLICAAALSSGQASATDVALVVPTDIQSSASTDLIPGQDAGGVRQQAAAVRRALESLKVKGGLDATAMTQLSVAYEAREFEPFWITNGRPSPQMLALRRRLDAADDMGLDPESYATPEFSEAFADDAGLRAAADVAFSHAVARYVTHIAAGRIEPTEVSRIITLRPERPDVGEALSRLSRTAGVALALSRYEPQHPEYQALKAALAELRAHRAAPLTTIPDGVALKPGGADPRVILLRRRLGITPVSGVAAEDYDEVLVEAVQTFQARSGLTADGILGPRTLLALNGASPEADIEAVLANLERWRWMPRDLGAFHIRVNVPEFTVRVVEAGALVHETRVVVGAPKHPTPTFSHVMDHLVVNPFWNVPTSILSNEMMPEIRRNPAGYFAKRGYQVLARAGNKMQVVDPDRIEWGMINPRSVRIRQVPGDENALGRIKFMFPNQHSVYLHDTPSKALFKKDYRAYSHGCVRVDDPLAFAGALLARASPDWNAGKLEKLYGGPERRINLQTPVPVHLSYFTRAVGADRQLRRFEDIYGYDAKMRALAGS